MLIDSITYSSLIVFKLKPPIYVRIAIKGPGIFQLIFILGRSYWSKYLNIFPFSSRVKARAINLIKGYQNEL